jgi:DNA polymerase III delta prime subunit
MIHNRIASYSFCNITNSSETDWHHIEITIEGDWVKVSRAAVEVIPKGDTFQVASLEIVPDDHKLIDLTEGIHTRFRCSLSIEGKPVFVQEYPLYLMAYDQWTGAGILPELLAAFVTPNHPILSRVAVHASKFLEAWTGDANLDEYQTQDPNRVRQQVAAIYEALRSESLVYCTPPASFEDYGQRVRLVDKVLAEKLGTCLDLTLLFASCLEAVGIHPILILLKGHIFVGAWLIHDMYARMVSDDASYLLKGCADGINELVLVEATALTSSRDVPFEAAVSMAENQLKDEERFELFVDVFRCRFGASGIRPLPQRINRDGLWQIENDGIEHQNATQNVDQLSRFEIKLGEDADKTLSKQVLWERKLLDFSLRNNLINIRLGRRVIPFISFEIDMLEDRLQAGENYQILPTPLKGKIEAGDSGIHDSSLYKNDLKELVITELHGKKIRSYLPETELQNALKFIYRSARTSIEENGANSLFLVLGLLKWYENNHSAKPRFAPLLLLPVDIVRRGGTIGYVMRTRNEEIMLNITLVELLKQHYGVNLSGLLPLPKDDSGVDVKLIFATIRTLIRDMKGWNVIEESMLGLFSFNKFVMWNDIHTHADKLRENPIISSLIDNRIKWEDASATTDARIVDREQEPASYALPVDVDSSQLEAVIEAGEGRSFILHGPPGTGKSQTITNMIANILYKGKRVLFVAEKMAALSVVQNRLSKIGLSPFCLEMHSNKATKTHFLEQLQKAIEVRHPQSPAAYGDLSRRLFERRKELIDHIDVLHRPQAFGYSLYDCIANYLSVEGEEARVEQAVLEEFDKERLESWQEKLLGLDVVFKVIGHPATHPLKGLYPLDFSVDAIDRLYAILARYRDAFSTIVTVGYAFFKDQFAMAVPDSMDGVRWMGNTVGVLCGLPLLNKRLLDIAADKYAVAAYQELIAAGQERDRVKSDLLTRFAPEALREDARALKQEWQAIHAKWFIPQYFAKRAYIKHLRLYNALLVETEVDHFLDDLESYQRRGVEVNERQEQLTQAFGSLAMRGKERWDTMRDTLALAIELYKGLVAHAQLTATPLAGLLSAFMRPIADNWAQFEQVQRPVLERLAAAFGEYDAARGEAAALCVMNLPDERTSSEVPLLLARWIAHRDKVKDWNQWCVRKAEMDSAHLDILVHGVEERHRTGMEIARALFKGVNHQMAMNVINADQSLRLFNGLLFEQLIDRYKQMSAEFQELTKKEVYCRLAARVPSLTMEAANSSEVGILKRNISNGGRGMSIRRIIDQIPTLLPKLCPCMLMSPISVAQYIDLDADKFDVVIFDEASQMPTSEAVGAIARGKALVVVGDPKQMPPTSFFSSSQVDEEEAAFDDMESILEDCLSLSMPSRYLSWHYRSKHESLIAFSNTQYYDGKLYTFPSVDDRASKVSLRRISGTYDKGRTRSNRAEAAAVVDEIVRRLRSDALSARSIGVVAFSQVQQNLIEDLLLDELVKHPDLEQIAFHGEEPIFIKNLENVQGDERDIILFSIGYGPDSKGNVSMNFGPLNNQGGERRLNVAVSRARYEMIVFSTLRSDQIDLKRTKSKGVEGLKKFLEFAEHGALVTPANQAHCPAQDNFIPLIARAIEQRGYMVDLFVGRSEFKVDIAVRNPASPDDYILGILCDGKTYYDAKTTRDREIVQPNVLGMLHWRIVRIWSVDWFENSQRVIDRVMAMIQEIQDERPEGPDGDTHDMADGAADMANDAADADAAEESVYEPVNMRETDYVFAHLATIDQETNIDMVLSCAGQVGRQLEQIIAIEQPITNTLLYKRIAEIWHLSRMSPRLQVMIDSLLRTSTEVHADSVSHDAQTTYWENWEKSENYTLYRVNSKRDILDIPIIEVMNAMCYVLEQQIALPAEDLKRLTSQVLGFSRKGTNLDAATGQALRLLSEKALVKDEGGRIRFADR